MVFSATQLQDEDFTPLLKVHLHILMVCFQEVSLETSLVHFSTSLSNGAPLPLLASLSPHLNVPGLPQTTWELLF